GNETSSCVAAPMRRNYASVVSGLGGAFHHPNQVRTKTGPYDIVTKAVDARIVPRRAWPGGGASDRAVGDRLIRPRKIFQAGAVGVIGMLLALLTYSTTLLEIPFEPRRPHLFVPALHLASVASVFATIGILGVITHLARRWGTWLHRDIQQMVPPSKWWAKRTFAVSHSRFTFWLLRWLGFSRRNLWGVLITSPAWATALAAWTAGLIALARCSYLPDARDGFTPAYIAITVVVLFMIVLATVMFFERYRA